MFRFYAQVVKRGFDLFFQSTAKWRNIVLVVVCVALSVVPFFSQQSGKRMMEAWIGLPAWVGLIPLVVLLIYGFLRANYNEFLMVRGE